MSAAEKIISLADRRAAVAPVEGKKRMQDGFIAIPNELEDALLRSPLTQRQERVFRAILRKTLGYGKVEDCIANSQLSEMTGIDEAHIRRAINDLMDMRLITRGRRTKFGTFTEVNCDVSAWNYKQAESARIEVQTGRIGTNKQAESAPHNRQLQKTEEKAMSPATAEDVKVPKTRKQAAPVADLLKLYNQTLGNRLPQVQVASEARKRQLSARWNEMLGSVRPDGKIRYQGPEDGLKWWGAFFAKVATNPHWMGDNDRGWTADFDWIVKPANFAKILEYRPAKKGGR